MRWDRRMLLVGVGVAAALAAFELPADARPRARAPARGKHRRHRFKSAPARAQEKSPAPSSDSGAVAGSAVEGGFRQDVVDGGAMLAMAPGRALVLNSYRGLSLVDTSDADAPRVLASISVEGTGERMLLSGDHVAVVSDARDADGAWTLVTSVAIGDSSLSVAGTARAGGALRDAVREGADLLLVTTDSYWGPYMMGVADGRPGGDNFTAAGAPSSGAPSDSMMPWYGGGGSSRVARVRFAADGTPSLLGTLDVDGDLLASAVTATEAVLAVSSGSVWQAGPFAGDPALGGQSNSGDPTGAWIAPTTSLVHVADDASGAPTSVGSLALDGVNGVAALDRAGSTLRALEYTDAGEILATFDVSGGAPSALGSLPLADWPSSFAFSGGAFVYSATNWSYDAQTPPSDPVFDPAGANAAFGGTTKAGNSPDHGGVLDPGFTSGPTSSLVVVDLRDPAHPTLGGSVDLGDGWVGGLVAVQGGVVGTTYGYDDGKGEGVTTLFRTDVSDPQTPASPAGFSVAGYASLGPVLGDLLLLNGGGVNETGSFLPHVQLVDLSGGGLAAGGGFVLASWTTTAARDADLLGVASYDRLSLIDVSDVNAPRRRGDLRLVVNVAGFAALSGTTGAALATDYVGGDVEIRTVSLPAAEVLAPLDVLRIGTGDARLFAAPPYLYVVSTDWSTGRASLAVVDATDPADLVLRGSLDLASYPGQVFLKGDALLLLREAYTLFTEDDRGRVRANADAFGRCPKSWMRQELGAVLDVVDLSDPDAPRAARRVRLAWDSSGSAILAGDSLFVSSYENLATGPDGAEQYAYMVREIDVTNPRAPRVRAAVDVPGTLVAATDEPHRILTTDWRWDEASGIATASLCLVDLSLPWNERVVASRPLNGWPETTTVAGGRAYVVVETLGDLTMQAGPIAQQTPSVSLLTLGLSDLAVAGTTSRDTGAYGGEVRGGRLFLRTWGWTGALDVYSLADPDAPAFVLSRSVAGLAGDIAVVGDRAYAPGGMYGVTAFDLSQ